MQKGFPVSIVTDCGGQALGRMRIRVARLFPDATDITVMEAASSLESGGCMVDAMDAMIRPPGAILCNTAPRRDAQGTNGSGIVFGEANGIIVIATAATLGLVKKLVPNFEARVLDVEAFMKRFWPEDAKRGRFNFRGLEVLPRLLASYWLERQSLTRVSSPFKHFPAVEPAVWLVDEIGGQPYNIKLTVLRSDLPDFHPEQRVRVQIGEREPVTMLCYERLADIPNGELGLYESSSGLGEDRFLEIGVMGESAAERLRCKVDDPVLITYL
jgi:hypothetical protein